MEYLALMAENLILLDMTVNQYIKQGWKPQGGIANSSGKFMQAIIREEKPLIIQPEKKKRKRRRKPNKTNKAEN